MTTTTPSPARKQLSGLRRARGMTLVEIMIGATIGSFVLTAVITTFLFMGRSGANVQHYSDMEGQARKALEMFAQDVRQASAISWTNNQTVTLTVSGSGILYGFSGTTFYRRNVSSGVQTDLVTGVSSFSFNAYNITGASLPLVTATDFTNAGKQTKQLQISLEARRQSSTAVATTNTVLSARFILRNKRVTA